MTENNSNRTRFSPVQRTLLVCLVVALVGMSIPYAPTADAKTQVQTVFTVDDVEDGTFPNPTSGNYAIEIGNQAENASNDVRWVFGRAAGTTAASGQYTLAFSSPDASATNNKHFMRYQRESPVEPSRIDFIGGVDRVGNNGDASEAQYRFRDENGDNMIFIGIEDSGQEWFVRENGAKTRLGITATGQYRDISIRNINWTQGNYDLYIDGNDQGNFGFASSGSGNFDHLQFRNEWDNDNTGSRNMTLDDFEVHRFEQSDLSGKVTDSDGNALGGATVEIPALSRSTTTDSNGRYTLLDVNEGTYNVTASKNNYTSQTKTVDILNGTSSTADFQLQATDAALSIDTRAFLEHGERAQYNVTYRNLTGSNENVTDVTEQANVTSQNTSIVTINEDDNEIVATGNVSVNARTFIRATYNDSQDTYRARQNVTVANLTTNNLKILPTSARLEAALKGGIDSNRNDRTVVVILIATMLGVAAAILATSFAGVALMSLTMIAGWLGGWVGNGMVMVSILTGLFIGLNVAANIDYSTIRRRD